MQDVLAMQASATNSECWIAARMTFGFVDDVP